MSPDEEQHIVHPGRRERSSQATKEFAAQQVHMEVRHLVASVRTVVQRQSVPGPGYTGVSRDTVGDAREMSHQRQSIFVQIGDRTYVFLRNHQHVGGGPRVDVANHECAVVFVDELTGEFPVADPTEDAARVLRFQRVQAFFGE